MCFTACRQLRLLLWKNLILHVRQLRITVIEILLPLIFSLFLIVIRLVVESKTIDTPTTWSSFNLSSLPSQLPSELSGRWILMYSPDTAAAASIMGRVVNGSGGEIHSARGFSSESAMVDVVMKNSTTAQITLACVVFSNFPTDASAIPQQVEYKLRLSYRPRAGNNRLGTSFGNWRTRLQFPVFQTVGPRDKDSVTGGDPGYYREGFLFLQHHIDRAVMAMLGVKADDEVDMQRIPFPPYIDDGFIIVIQQQFAFFLIVGFFYTALNVTKMVCHEKEKKLKETMRMMGLQSWLHWTAWFIDFFVKMLVVCIGIVIICKVPVGTRGRVLTFSNAFPVLIFLLLYVSCVIFFCFAISTFFKTARSGALAGGLLFLLSYLPNTFLQQRYSTTSVGLKILCCLLPNMALALGGTIIGQLEGSGAGLQWDNLYRGVSIDDNFSMGYVMAMMFFDCVLYMVIAWYKEGVSPGEYGIPQPWFFPFTSSYWCGTKPQTVDVQAGSIDLNGGRRHGSFGNPNIEQDPRNLRCTISLRNLCRRFGKKKAVDNLSINIYEGQITALLGHNGAGKTTTMSMIAGFIPSTSGQIFVNDLDIQHNLSTVRRQLGLCPQHDVLFDSLTVEEHLRFFAQLKDFDESLIAAEIDRLIDATNLGAKRGALSKTLSGGMKRRLSVAIALVGGSKVVILDEPTSGLDPSARRELWTFLQAERSRCTILLSTHFMDEADFLGDRIAIMAGGEIQCCGSSIFLKSRYGAGYHLTMVKTPRCNPDNVLRIVQAAVPEAKLESNVGDELSFILPTEAAPQFEALFARLETDSNSLGIGGYGASITTMEEVFLKVGEAVEANDEPITDSGSHQAINGVGGPTAGSTAHLVGSSADNYLASRNNGVRLFLQQVRGIFEKRVRCSLRSYIVSLTQIIIPIAFAALGLLVLKTQPSEQNMPALALNLAPFGRQVITVASSPTAASADHSLAAAFAGQFSSRPLTSFLNVTGVNETVLFQRMSDAGDGRLGRFNREYLIGGFFSPGHGVALFNNQPYHTPGIALNALSNAVLRASLPTASIATQNAPLPMTVVEKVSGQSQTLTGFASAVNVVMGMAYLAASFSFLLVKERVTKVKLLHFVSGTSKTAYWLATFLWDFVNFLIPTIGILIVFLGFGIEAYTGTAERVFGIILLLLLYGWAVIPLVYNFSHLFNVPSTAIAVISAVNFMTGLATLSTVVVLQVVQQDSKVIPDTLKIVFTILFPDYGLGQALVDYYTNYVYIQNCAKPEIQFVCKLKLFKNPCCKDFCEQPNCIDYTENFLGFEKGGIGMMLVALAAQGLVFSTLCVLLESSLATQLRAALMPSRRPDNSDADGQSASSTPAHLKVDADVAAERARVLNTDAHVLRKANSLVLSEVSHLYGSHLAVDRISCAIPLGDCFGLLGVNGAGKTTTFKMITGDIPASEGDAIINGHSVTRAVEKVRLNLGYCPQFDGLIEYLTGREMLFLFARLRGLKENLIATEVNYLITALLLQPHADKLTRNYSGGNKRKLSTAMALVGGPAVVCLDEPTTGMDPVARRHLWRTIASFRERGHTIVLTSHSMEECEALCTKIAIMVNGQFKCFGSCQHLKAKFGSGYSLQLQVPFSTEEGAARVANAQQFVEGRFPSAELVDIHQGVLHYHLHPHDDLGWSKLFGILERNKETLMLDNYSVSQTTLEQVFLSFARNQIPPEEKSQSCTASCWRCITCSSK